jgi:glutamate synthase (NADPH/NADH) large chain
VGITHTESQNHPIDKVLDRKLIEAARPALENGTPVRIVETITSVDRSAGAMLGGAVAKRYGHAGLPDDTIAVSLTGTAGQAFGAWATRGISLDLVGEANDYVGKGLSGARLVVRPPEQRGFVPEESIIIGNTALYGAITGECYFRGVAGERFAVRNSGAIAVVEGTGDHGCEYMTGGVVVVLGRTGRNFAAGMSGGVAYVLDEDETFESRCNMSMVELEPVPEEETLRSREFGEKGDLLTMGVVEILHDLQRRDAERLYQLILRHKTFTGSSRANHILSNWDEYLPRFRKVMPTEYRKALQKMEQAREAAQRVAAE